MVPPNVSCVRVPYPSSLHLIRDKKVDMYLSPIGFFVARHDGDTVAFCESSKDLQDFLSKMGARAVSHNYDCTKEK